MPEEKDFYNVSLKLLLKNDKGEVLGLKADPRGTLAGFYDFPDGRINKDEFHTPFTEILKREVQEELGNVQFRMKNQPVAIGRHIVSKNPEVRVLLVFFEAEYLGGEIQISAEHTGTQWIDLHNEDPKKYFTSGALEGVLMYLGK